MSVNAKLIKVCLFQLYTNVSFTLILIVAANIIYYSIEFEKPRLILLVLKNLGSKVTNQRQGRFPERSVSVRNVVDSSNFVANLLFTF